MLTKHPQKPITTPRKDYPQNRQYQSKRDKRPLSKKNKNILSRLSFNRWSEVWTPSKTLLFLSVHKIQKMAYGITRNTPHLALLFQKNPSQAKSWYLIVLDTTQWRPKQHHAKPRRFLANGPWKSRCSVVSNSDLHMKNLLTKILPLFCKLSQLKI